MGLSRITMKSNKILKDECLLSTELNSKCSLNTKSI